MIPPPVDPLVGTEVAGTYRVVRVIGRGGMGAVYEVAHTRIRRSFALKTLATHLVNDAEAVARFRREADIIASLHHPNIVDIVDWQTLGDGSPCMIMELLVGESLAQRLKREGAVPLVQIMPIVEPILQALSVAHGAGIVHRDLKPQNIFLVGTPAGDQPKLLDFGVSKIRDASSIATTDDRILGTPSYMSPEQAEGRQAEVGPRSDVWAMGAIIYEMATGARAFTAANVPSLLYRICHGEPEQLADHLPHAPRALRTLVAHTMSRDASVRIVDAEVLRTRLGTALDVETTSSSRVARAATGASAAAVRRSAEPELPDVPTTMSTANGQRAIAARSLTRGLRPRRAAAWLTGGAIAAIAVAGGFALVYDFGAPASEGSPKPAVATEAPRVEERLAATEVPADAGAAGPGAVAGAATEPSIGSGSADAPLRAAVDPAGTRKKTEVRTVRKPAETRGRLALIVPGGKTAVVIVDGKKVTLDRAHEVALASGSHGVVVRVDGMEPEKLRVEIVAGKTTTPTVKLRPLAARPNVTKQGSGSGSGSAQSEDLDRQLYKPGDIKMKGKR